MPSQESKLRYARWDKSAETSAVHSVESKLWLLKVAHSSISDELRHDDNVLDRPRSPGAPKLKFLFMPSHSDSAGVLYGLGS